MANPIFDLGSLCSSPILYGEGEDFLEQPVNTFFDEDLNFDFIDAFEDGFSISGNASEIWKGDTHHKKDWQFSVQTPTLPIAQTNGEGHVGRTFDIQAQNTFSGDEGVNGNDQVSPKENSIKRCTYTSEYTNTSANEDKASDEDTALRTLSKNAKELSKHVISQSQTELADRMSLSKSGFNKSRITTNSQADIRSNTTETVSVDDSIQNFEDNTYISSNVNEKSALNKETLLSHGSEHTMNTIGATKEKTPSTKDLKKLGDVPFAPKHSGLKRCVVPKTFYSPFWKPDKSTPKGNKSLEDSFINTQRNVDILYCCNCKSQKPFSRFVASKPLSSTTNAHRDRNDYVDFLKRNSTLEPQRNCHKKGQNKTINGETSSKITFNEVHNEEKWILPPIYTSKTLRQKAVRKRASESLYLSSLSTASVEGLINKYKGKHLDLVEQQKRYQLKPFR